MKEELASLGPTFDFYAFVGHWPYWSIEITTPDKLIALMDRFGIQQAAVLSLRGIFVDSEKGNREAVEAAVEFPNRLIPFGTLRPDAEKGLAELEQSLQDGVRGFRLHPIHQNYRLKDNPALDFLLKEIERRKLPVVVPLRIIMNWALPVLPAPDLLLLFDKFPEVKFVIAGANYGEVGAIVDTMQAHPNVFLETSCLQTMGAMERLCQKVGSERLLFGSGMPLQYPACGLAKIIHAKVGLTEKHLILSENARRLLS